MESSIHRFSDLFAQLGLHSDGPAIQDFIAQHAPLDGRIRLHDAPFWNAANSRMLQEMTADDADWAELVDQLDVALRQVCAQPDARWVAIGALGYDRAADVANRTEPDSPQWRAPTSGARV